MSQLTSPEWAPDLVYIAAHQIKPEQPIEPQIVLEKMQKKYGGDYSKDDRALEFKSGRVSGYVHCETEDKIQSYLIALSRVNSGKKGDSSLLSWDKDPEIIEDLKQFLPGSPVCNFTLRFIHVGDKKEALALIQRYEGNKRRLKCAGLIGDFLLFSRLAKSGSSGKTHSREFVILPHEGSGTDVNDDWTLSFDLFSLTILSGQMYVLYNDRRLMFEQMEASETSTQMRINEIVAQLRRPVEEIKPSDLEDILKEITVQFSRLSTLGSTMTRDHVKIKTIFRNLRGLLRGLNESPYENYMTITSDVTEEHEGIIVPFEVFIGRAEALHSQLNTVLDSVRTYLGIQQQKISIMEQTSSREQLVRLVNLQEILHKLEILVVAFYLTEMARIIIETVSHENAGLLTAAFIPFALLISILIGKVLHKPH